VEGCLTDTVETNVSGNLNPWPEDEGSYACERDGGPSNPANRWSSCGTLLNLVAV
jgi:hypothetical protein